MTPPIYKRGKLDPSEYGKVVSMAEHASHWRFAMGVTCIVAFVIGAMALWLRLGRTMCGGEPYADQERCGA
jgi:hypothetical protein